MAISTTTNFDINRAVPIDSRLVASNSTARNAITFKYAGLKVYQLDDNNTYVYDTTGTWSLDGGAVEGLGGIYNGDGSLPKNVNVNFGAVGQVTGTESRKLKFYGYDSSTIDESQILNYFYRRTNAGQWTNMTYMIDHQLVDVGISKNEQSSFIAFNYPTIYPERGVLALGSQSPTDPQSKLPYLLISPRNYIMFRNSSDEANSLTIGFDGGSSYLGVNYNPNTDNSSYPDWNSETIDPEIPAGRLGFSDKEFKYQSRNAQASKSETEIWEDIISISNEASTSTETSIFKVRIDNSAFDWDRASIRNHSLQSINNFVRNSEHKFTKLQSWNEGTLYNRTIDGFGNVVLILNDNGNSFTCNIDFGTIVSIREIRLWRDGQVSDFPTGAIITIKFFITQESIGSHILLLSENQLPKTGSSTIYSKISDETFSVNSTLLSPSNKRRLSILQTPGSYIGDTMVFRKIPNGWDIISVERQNKITERNWYSAGLTTDPWNFSKLFIIQYGSSNLYKFTQFTNAIIQTTKNSSTNILNRPPNTYIFSTVEQSTFREDINLSENFKLRISVDGNRLVSIQGNFQVSFSQNLSARSLFTTNTTNRPNVWRIGKINEERLRPIWDSSWTYCSGYFAKPNSSDVFTMSEVIFSVQQTGEMFVSFYLTTLPNYDPGFQPVVDFWIPPFNYTAATTSTTSSGGGGGGGAS